MKLTHSCIECQSKTVLRVLDGHGVTPELRDALLTEQQQFLQPGRELGRSLSEFYAHTRGRIGVDDPLAQAKADNDAAVLGLVPMAQEMIADHPDPLYAAVRVAAVGNMMDFSFGTQFDVHQALLDSLELDFAINDLDRLRDRLRTARDLTLCTDNAGEIVFDRLLLDTIRQWRANEGLPPLRLTVVVKGGPAINDALRADATAARMGEIADVRDTGTASIGVIRSLVEPSTLAHLDAADLILTKGMANFETTVEDDVFRPRTFYLLKAKCAPVAGMLGVPVGSLVLADGAVHRPVMA
ncbi:damage-control phosphatase ARMT1 family protein [Propionicicella superfundia]|uniref:damage-control phosphatase ARMT1 family protein n=1 Tax=Propionicicella superfundia TaxID=348582 RepID=UPI00041A2D70|nr:ARMT1-like domain-containing protein [Propionicicella superfundia]